MTIVKQFDYFIVTLRHSNPQPTYYRRTGLRREIVALYILGTLHGFRLRCVVMMRLIFISLITSSFSFSVLHSSIGTVLLQQYI